MAYAVKRAGSKGDRWTGYYRTSDNRTLSAGTFATEEQAQSVAEGMETWVPKGTAKDPAYRATVTLDEYAEVFLRLHAVAPVTARGYESVLNNHVLPQLGRRRVAELEREEMRELLRDHRAAGMSPTRLRRVRIIVSAMMGMAIADGYRQDNPAKGLKTPQVSRKELTVLTVEQYKRLRKCLPTKGARALAHLVVSSGMRFGEATALVVGDIDYETKTLMINKAVSDVGAKWHPNGRDRFMLNPYPKNKKPRVVKLDATCVKLVREFCEEHDLQPGDLIFDISRVQPASTRGFPTKKYFDPLTPERLREMGTFIAANGLEYQHGSINGYITGKCKCDGCLQAASEYSAGKRAEKRARTKHGRPIQPRHYSVNTQGYLSRDAWGDIWTKAVKDAEIDFKPTAYQLRHTHASWLIEMGEDPKTVMGRLGHSDLSVTSLYVHRSATDDSAADIMGDLFADDEDEDVA